MLADCIRIQWAFDFEWIQCRAYDNKRPGNQQNCCFYNVVLSSCVYLFLIVHTEGPLSVFKVAMTTKEVINVWIRHSAGLRGVCTGKIRVFDRHWNIVMNSNDRCYSVALYIIILYKGTIGTGQCPDQTSVIISDVNNL